MKNNFALLIVSAFLFAGCGQATDTGSESQDVPTTSFAEANARRNVWSKTEEMLSDAKTAFDNGDVDAAIDLATEAKLQAELAVIQSDFEEDARRSRVLTE